MDTSKPVGVPLPPAELDLPPGYPPPWDVVVVGRVWIRIRLYGHRILGRLRRRGSLPRERVVVLRYSRARVTRALAEKMRREGRDWCGWRVGYKVLPPGSGGRTARGLPGPMRWKTEEDFRATYRRVGSGEEERQAKLAARAGRVLEEG